MADCTTACVTVVVCAKNEATRIGACLDSLASQDVAGVVVVDGASTDNTARVALSRRAQVVISDAGNLSLDRQVGADMVTTDLVAFVDADHRLPPGTIAGLVEDLVRFDLDGVQALARATLTAFRYGKRRSWQFVGFHSPLSH